MYGSLSNEGRIAHGLKLLNLPITNFCRLSGIPKTKFMQAMSGDPGCSLSDEIAQRALSFIERLYDLQLAADEITKDANGRTVHVPLDWSKLDQIGDALVVRLAQQVCVEQGDHQLDQVANHALRAVWASEGWVVRDPGKN